MKEKNYCSCGCIDNLQKEYYQSYRIYRMACEEVRNLSADEFDKLARSQVDKFPDLLKFDTEEGVIDCFYEFYKRKRVNNEKK